MGNWYKQSNSLARSLGIEWDDPEFAKIQKYERKLKEDGFWQKLLDMRKGKSDGRRSNRLTVKLELNEILDQYEAEDIGRGLNKNKYVEFLGKTSSGNEWWHMPQRTMHDPAVPLEELQKTVNDLFCGGNWCISQPSDTTKSLVNGNKGFNVLRRGGSPRVALVYQDSGLYEVRAIANNIDNLDAIDILDLRDNPMFSFEQIKKNMEEVHNQDLAEDLGNDEEQYDEYRINIEEVFQEKFMEATDSMIENSPRVKHAVEIFAEGMKNKILGSIDNANTYYALKRIAKIIGKMIDSEHTFVYNMMGKDLEEAVKNQFSKEQLIEALPRAMSFSNRLSHEVKGLNKLVEHISHDEVQNYIDSKAQNANGRILFWLLRNLKYYKSLWGELTPPDVTPITNDPGFVLDKGYKGLPLEITVPTEERGWELAGSAMELIKSQNAWNKIDNLLLFTNDLTLVRHLDTTRMSRLYEKTIEVAANSICEFALAESYNKNCASFIRNIRFTLDNNIVSGKLRKAIETHPMLSYCRNNDGKSEMPIDGNWYNKGTQGPIGE